MLSSVLINMTSALINVVLWSGIAVNDEIEVISPVVIGNEALATRSWPEDLPAPISETLDQYSLLASDYGLSAYVTVVPSVVLFTKTEPDDADHMMRLIVATHDEFEGRFDLFANDRQPLAVFHLQESRGADAGYDHLIEIVVESYPYLKNWGSTAQGLLGFAIYQPLVVAILETDGSTRELNRDNNLVHFVAMNFLYQYFGVQPYWVRKGVALDMEIAVLDRLFALSYDPMQPLGRVGAWRRKLAKVGRNYSEKDLAEVVSLEDQRMDAQGWLQAIAVIKYLSIHKPRELASILRSFVADRDAHLREDPYYIPSPERQIEILDLHLDDGWLEELRTVPEFVEDYS